MKDPQAGRQMSRIQKYCVLYVLMTLATGAISIHAAIGAGQWRVVFLIAARLAFVALTFGFLATSTRATTEGLSIKSLPGIALMCVFMSSLLADESIWRLLR